MGCCQLKQTKASDKDEPLLSTTIESTEIENGNSVDMMKIESQKHQKRNSKIDVQDLMKFQDFTQRMEATTAPPVNIRINIKSVDTKFPLFSVEMDQNLSILELKNKISQESPDKIEAFRQRLIHKGRLLKDARQLKQYNISNENTIMLVRSRKKKQKHSNHAHMKDQRTNSRHRAMTLNVDSVQFQNIRSKTPQPQ
eukprot:245225_1